MIKNSKKSLLAISLFLMVLLIAGCSGSDSGLQRVAGLTTDGVVKTFINAAQNGRMNEAALYVSSASKADPQTVLKFMTGQTGMVKLRIPMCYQLTK